MRTNQAGSNNECVVRNGKYELMMDPFELSELEARVLGIFIKRGCPNNLSPYF